MSKYMVEGHNVEICMHFLNCAYMCDSVCLFVGASLRLSGLHLWKFGAEKICVHPCSHCIKFGTRFVIRGV